MNNSDLKMYQAIGDVRLLNIEVILNDNQLIYKGWVEDAPQNIKEMRYSKVEVDSIMKFYVYS